jgi:hypothetical protein
MEAIDEVEHRIRDLAVALHAAAKALDDPMFYREIERAANQAVPNPDAPSKVTGPTLTSN